MAPFFMPSSSHSHEMVFFVVHDILYVVAVPPVVGLADAVHEGFGNGMLAGLQYGAGVVTAQNLGLEA